MTFKDNYKWLSGWIHDYYCDIDSAELLFNINNNKFFECPICHHKYTDIKRKRAWITKYRYNIFNLLEEYSHKYLKTKKQEYLTFIEDALNYYSINYNKFPIHSKDNNLNSNNCGKITAQGLNEAMIAINIVNAINNVKAYLNEKTIDNVFNLLFPQIYHLLKPQINRIHNIDCYQICALGMIGILTKDKNIIDYAFNSPYSFYEQLNNGVTKDYFWFEGSFHYHFFILKPILELLSLAQKLEYHIPSKYYTIASKMLQIGYNLSFNDTSLPSPNDGWPNRKLKDYLEVFILGNTLFKGKYKIIINKIKDNKGYHKSIHLPNTGFSILKNKYWNVFIKYQDNILHHTHQDNPTIEIKCENNFLTHDLSTSGYGSTISKDFYKARYAHNTIMINDKTNNSKTIVNNYDNSNIQITVKDLYPNTIIRRKISINNKILIDNINVKTNSNKKIDYIFHSDAQLHTKLKTIKTSNFKEYPYFSNIKEIITPNKTITLTWRLNQKNIKSIINLTNKKLFIYTSPNNPNINKRTTLIIRSTNSKNNFNITWQLNNIT